MRGRRWGDWVNSDGDMSVLDRSRRVIGATWPFVASAAAMAVVLAATIVSVGAIRDRDRLAAVATNAADAARDAKAAAAASAEAAERNRELLEQAKPCLVGDPPESAACQQADRRAVLTNDAIARIASELATGIAAHDANASTQLDALRARLGVRSPLPARTPITAATRTTPATIVPPAPTTTTTTCETLPNGKCRP